MYFGRFPQTTKTKQCTYFHSSFFSHVAAKGQLPACGAIMDGKLTLSILALVNVCGSPQESPSSVFI